MQVSPQAQRFSDLHALEETDEMREKFAQMCREGKIIDKPVEPATIVGSRVVLRALQDDLRKAGYRKI